MEWTQRPDAEELVLHPFIERPILFAAQPPAPTPTPMPALHLPFGSQAAPAPTSGTPSTTLSTQSSAGSWFSTRMAQCMSQPVKEPLLHAALVPQRAAVKPAAVPALPQRAMPCWSRPQWKPLRVPTLRKCAAYVPYTVEQVVSVLQTLQGQEEAAVA